jgi:hypothetical protein
VLGGALATLFAAVLAVAASTAAGAGVLAACGRERWSWTAPAIGLAAITIVGWWAVRLPGHGWTALAAVVLAAIAGGTLAAARLEGAAEAVRGGAPIAAGALAVGCVPFVVEAHFGVLGSGFNVDMSQHLYAASWLADPSGSAPGLFEQGYPLGPHALAVAAEAVTGELTTAFSGVTIAVPAIVALTTLAGAGDRRRRTLWVSALLVAFAYLAASLLAQGSFKELFEVALLLGVVFLLAEREGPEAGSPAGWRSGVPFAVLGAGTLYAYSSPGLAWPAAALLAWAAAELLRRRDRAGHLLKRAAPALGAGLIVLLLLAAPEIDRIVDFGGSVGTVSEGGRAEAPRLLAAVGDPPGIDRAQGPKFDDDLGNLFGQVTPLEALNVWPSGDFRVEPGDGKVPAPAFYLGALLGAAALLAGGLLLLRGGSTALLAGLVAAAAIWLAARIGSTPYTTAKALAIAAPLTMAVSLGGLLGPREAPRGALPLRLLALAFCLAAAGSSLLALGNAPVGPRDYTPGIRDLSDRFAGEPTLLLAPRQVIADQHGREFYSWEIREAAPACVEAEGFDGPLSGVRRVITLDGEAPPFAGAREVARAGDVVLWRVPALPGDVAPGRNGECDFSPLLD